MFRFSGLRLLTRSAALLNTHRDIPEAFDFVENKALDKDIHANYENKDTLSLTLTRQDEFLMKEHPVRCVTIMSTNGECGVFPGHAYEIAKLVPSPITVELPDGQIRKYFTSGGFAHINNEGSCDINCVECIPLAELDLEAAEKALAEQNTALGAAKDENAKSVIEIRIGVLESVIQTLRH